MLWRIRDGISKKRLRTEARPNEKSPVSTGLPPFRHCSPVKIARANLTKE
jgi:hypothetical protein